MKSNPWQKIHNTIKHKTTNRIKSTTPQTQTTHGTNTTKPTKSTTPPKPQNPQHHQHKPPTATHIHGKVAPQPRSGAILFCMQSRPRWINQRRVRRPSQGRRRWPEAVDATDLDAITTVTSCGERGVRKREERNEELIK